MAAEQSAYPNRSTTPTADAVERFLRNFVKREHRSQLETGLDPERARLLASQIAKTEEGIIYTAKTFPYGHHVSQDDRFAEDPLNLSIQKTTTHTGDHIRVTKFTYKIDGLGDISTDGQHVVNFFYNQTCTGRDLHEKYGVNAPYYFKVSTFTDAATLPEITKRYTDGGLPTEFMYTDYAFDKDGNFAKTFQLPRNFPDDRPVVESINSYKTLMGNMTMADFILAKKAIDLLRININLFRERVG